MESDSQIPEYALGNTHAEHRRLMRQAERLDPLTERLFREAGIGPGQRVLDIGSGAGDVAMLAARLVGISGEVVGLERDIRSIHRARARVAAAGLYNVTFTQCDVSEVASGKQFDADVGRLILQFLPSPTDAVSALSRLVRPGGVIAFNEPSWEPFQVLSAHLPLYSATASIIHRAFQRCGPMWKWECHFTRCSKMLGCQFQPCFWKWFSEMIRASLSGYTIFSALCVRRPCNTSFPLSRWVISTLYRKGSKPRLQHRRSLLRWWPSSVPGPGSQQSRQGQNTCLDSGIWAFFGRSIRSTADTIKGIPASANPLYRLPVLLPTTPIR